MNGYQELANAIIVQACKDYRRALKILKKFPGDKGFLSGCTEIENFFHSSLYGTLTNIDGDILIAKIREEVGI